VMNEVCRDYIIIVVGTRFDAFVLFHLYTSVFYAL
jgi:hypothetical protein